MCKLGSWDLCNPLSYYDIERGFLMLVAELLGPVTVPFPRDIEEQKMQVELTF